MKIKTPFLIVLFHMCFSTIGFAKCTETEEKTASQLCNVNLQSENTSIDAMYFLPTEDGVLKGGGDVGISMGKQII
ncbi:MAG: hypothetical protein L3J83_12730, partial [Proteobacteria bacterium]|nr:hypothetical protein [Pseudomonadota bacterium]